MKKFSNALQQHLDSGATTLCHCWRLTRHDGTVLGFTDHDKNLSFDGAVFEAVSGFLATEMRETLGLGIDQMEVDSALSSLALKEEDLQAGLYDDARVEIFWVNWQAPSQFILLRYGSLGEITRGATSFSAEVRGMAHYLNQTQGRSYQYNCDAILGDKKCGISFDDPLYKVSTQVAAQQENRVISLPEGINFEKGWFSHGLLSWTSGSNNGLKMEIKRDYSEGNIRKISLWQPMVKQIAAGDAFIMTAGCDKHFSTCRDRFSNSLNFRGFPHMPGNDFITSYPSASNRDLRGQSLQ